jgi:hypothetical protein
MRPISAAVAVLSCGLALAAAPSRGADLAAPVRVFEAGELTLARYTVLQRLWTGSWRASFWIPAHADAGAAIKALAEQAASLGADAIVNLHCLNDAGGWSPGYSCYGLAIKLKP